MKFLFLAFALCVVALPAVAQTQRPSITPMQEAVDAAYALGLQTGQAFQKRQDDLDAYAKACGDKPGCFTPVPPDGQ